MSLEEASGRTFSDTWHRVAGVRAHLRTSVTAHRQIFRGQPWMVLRDKFSHEWFRVTPDAWTFLCRLGEGTTVDEAWNRSLEFDAGRALTQEEVVQLIGPAHGIGRRRWEDLADAAVTVLKDPRAHAGMIYELSGAEAWSVTDLADALGVAYKPSSFEAMRGSLAGAPLKPFQPPMLMSIYSSAAAGFLQTGHTDLPALIPQRPRQTLPIAVESARAAG